MSDLGSEFWRAKALTEMSGAEWESLCDGCGRCCLVKLEDVDTGELHHTDVACRLFDHETCRCGDYDNRLARVPDCVALTVRSLGELDWLPPTCAYRLLHEGHDLYWWHPLVTCETVVEAGISVLGRVVPEDEIAAEDLQERCVRWPAEDPRTG